MDPDTVVIMAITGVGMDMDMGTTAMTTIDRRQL